MLLLAVGLTMLSGCSDDDAPAAPSTTAPPATDAAATPTTTPPECDALADSYLIRFFDLGAGTPTDPADTTVVLPREELREIEEAAADQGCADFTDVLCSAYAELDAQGLEATNGEPPAAC